MATIFMSMSGEGRGHATRIRSLVERLRHKHQITLFAPGDAYRFLETEYGQTADVRLVEIPGLKFHYVAGRIHLIKTVLEGLRYEHKILPGVCLQLQKEIETHQPEIILTDFEPALPRAAQKCKRPFLSLTHQHFLLAYDLSILPRKLRFFAWMIGLAVPLHYTGQKVTLISSFFQAPLKPAWKKRGAIALGPMIRPEVRERALAAGIPVDGPIDASADSQTDLHKSHPSQPPFLVSYLRKFTTENVLNILEQSPLPVKVYGLGTQPARGPLTFHEIHPTGFVDDLVACTAVVSAAGNQLLGECMYLGKPVLALPETWHHEQLINAHFLRHMGCGNFVTLETFRRADLFDFLDHLEKYRTQIESTCLGNDGTLSVVSLLSQEMKPVLPTPALATSGVSEQ